MIYFTTVTHLPNRSSGEIFKALKGIFYYYLQRGFHITFITGDGEFSSLEQFTNLLVGAPRLNLASANEHELFIERRIRMVKERVCSIRHSLPLQTIPKIVLTHMVFYSVKLLNYFPVKGGVSEIYGPKAVMSGEILDFKKFSLPFGSYCQVHEKKLPRNSLASRTIGAISLGPSRNTQGGQKFFTLNTSKIITRRSWDVLPMPQSVIDRVNFIGWDQPSQAVFLFSCGLCVLHNFDTHELFSFFPDRTNLRAAADGAGSGRGTYYDFVSFDVVEIYKLVGILFANDLTPKPRLEY